MYDVKRADAKIGASNLSLESGKLAKQADGAVVITYGDTQLLVTAVASPKLREGIDFFPLTVDIEERYYAVGRIPGGFFRREGRASEKGILTARLTDRPIRPTFPEWFRHDVQIIVTVLQSDASNQFDIHCITAASAALTLGGIPFAGPVAGVRLAHIAGEWVVNPTYEQMPEATIELIVAGRGNLDGTVDILMIEAGGFEQTVDLIAEGADKPDEALICAGLKAAEKTILEICELQRSLAAQVEIPTREWIHASDYGDDVYAKVDELGGADLQAALAITKKQERASRIDEILANLTEKIADEFEGREREIKPSYRSLQKKLVRKRIIEEGVRMDGRGPQDIRALHSEAGVLSRAHGSALFQRGETQALGIATLAMPRMEQKLDTIYPEESRRYMHHYFFPPFSTGEAYPLRGPSRRAIGHGALAEKAVFVVLPPPEEFPYAIRVVSEILESNGSTSMAATCASCLALMDAGVPMRGIIGGIAMGLVIDGDRSVTLTDIIGAEDNYGDMDFKVAGTEEFITALQMDTKTTGIRTEVLTGALEQAYRARLEIIASMKKALDAPRPDLREFAPRIEVVNVPTDKIGEIIGPKGKMITTITERTETQIDIEDDGRVFVSGLKENVERAKSMIQDIAFPRMLSVGEEFEGTVVNIREFGAFVNVLPGKDGLIHISKLGKKGQRVNKPEDVVSVGDTLQVRVSEIRPDGKLSLELVSDDNDGKNSSSADD